MTKALVGAAVAVDTTATALPRSRPAAVSDPRVVLRAAGWPVEALHRSVVQTGSSSHLLARVSAGQRVAVVKQAPPQARAQQRHLANELFFYRLVRSRPALGRIAPRPLWQDEQRQWLVIEDAAGGAAPGTRAAWPPPPVSADDAPAVAAMAGLLATLHRHTRGLSLGGSPALGVLGLPDHLATACEGRSGGAVAVMQAIVADPVLSRALRQAAGQASSPCLVHGDVRAENWARSASGKRLRLIDWELTGVGDPAWDLGSLCAQHRIDALGRGRSLGVQHHEQLDAVALQRHARALKRAGLPPLATAQVLRMAAARLAHRAIECAEGYEGADALQAAHVRAMLGEARVLARRVADMGDPAANAPGADAPEARWADRERADDALRNACTRLGTRQLRQDWQALRAHVCTLPSAVPVSADELYAQWYGRLDPPPSQAAAGAAAWDLAGADGAAWLASVLPSTAWQRGWICLRHDGGYPATGPGGLVAGLEGRLRRLGPLEAVNLSRPGVPAAPGDELAVPSLVHWVDEATGYFVVHGSAGEPAGDLLRAYWSVGADHVAAVLHPLVDMLERQGWRFSLKCSTRADAYGRRDSLVCYVGAAQAEAALEAWRRLARRLRHHLRAQTPRMALRLAHGLAVAADPGDGASFGQVICRCLADEPSAEALRRAGIDPARPWGFAGRASGARLSSGSQGGRPRQPATHASPTDRPAASASDDAHPCIEHTT